MTFKKYSIVFLIFSLAFSPFTHSQSDSAQFSEMLMKEGLSRPQAYRMVQEITKLGPRLTGSANYSSAVDWAFGTMKEIGLERVTLQKVVAPHWIRGKTAEATAVSRRGESIPLTVVALGGSIATPKKGITAEVIEVKSFDELKAAGDRAKGKIVFFNRPMDPVLRDTFQAYSGAAEQRSKGAVEAARAGAVASMVRSLTLSLDDVPHTGGMSYDAAVPKIPAAALSTVAANKLSSMLENGSVKVTLRLDAQILPDVETSNVIGEIRGSELPDEVVVIGAHLDSWDAGTGAHDDAAGCAHVLEAARLILKTGLMPRRTIRVVLFANEENGLRGGKTYAAESVGEKHVAAIESDAGGFAPRGFSVNADPEIVEKVQSFAPVLAPAGAVEIAKGFGGADLLDLAARGVVTIALRPESQRYFDYHHSAKDTIDKVHPRELELGAISVAILALSLANNGL